MIHHVTENLAGVPFNDRLSFLSLVCQRLLKTSHMEVQVCNNTSACNLPYEILLKIFALCKQKQGLISLCNLSQVSRSWRKLAFDHSLWEEIDDISLSLTVLQELAYLGVFSKTTSLNLHQREDPNTDRCILSILQHCPKLQFIHLSHKIGLPYHLKDLLMFCPEITGFTFSQPFSSSARELDSLLEKCGQQLTKFALLDVDLDNAALATMTISRRCPNLREFAFTCSSREHDIPISALESGCPKLTKLKLTVNGFTTDTESKSGFSHLEELDFSSFKRYTLDEPDIARVLRTATRLRVLSLYDCNIACETLLNLPSLNLKALTLSYCSIDPPSGLSTVLNKWRHSLTMLSIMSLYVEDGDLVDHIQTFVEAGGGNSLETLKLQSEPSSQKILTLVKKCLKLRYLKLLNIHLRNKREIEKWILFCS